jgi:hypothetical protein
VQTAVLFHDLYENLANVLASLAPFQATKGYQSCLEDQMSIFVPYDVVGRNREVRVQVHSGPDVMSKR